MNQDLVIVGGGMGGCAAALAACNKGLHVTMIEETEWIGGQVTSQGVPPDEHPWIEQFGCTKRYREYRTKVRQVYSRILETSDGGPLLNPGSGIVSSICHDPRVSLHVLNEMVMPYVLTDQLTIKLNTKVVSVQRTGSKLFDLRVTDGKQEKIIKAPYYIDASETGEMLPLAEMDYTAGAESKEETNEPHASEAANSDDIQAFTYVLPLEYQENKSNIIPKPEMYAFWREFQPDFWPDKYLSFYAPHPVKKEKRLYTLFREEEGFPLWEYRRIFDYTQFNLPVNTGDITLMNWPQNDYFLGNIYDVTEEEKQSNLYKAKQLSLSLLYWLQTEAPRKNGGKGYPGLKLRKDVFDTEDGFAKAPYIRESRRIKAEYTITERDISPKYNNGKVGKKYNDSVGIGSYSIDLHPSMSGRNYLDIKALPYHIPLGALIPTEVDNLLAGSKNIGTTHITNGCYRLHPTEWNIGEACGALVAFCLKNKTAPEQVRNNNKLLNEFQSGLLADGFQLEWPTSFYE